MKALQQIVKHKSTEDAQEYVVIMSEQEGFLGGRVLTGSRTQLFFDCDQNMEYGVLTEETNYSERIIKVMDSQRPSVGIGNTHSHISPIQVTEQTEKLPDVEVATIREQDWLEAADKAHYAWWDARKSGNFTEYKRLQKTSHDLYQIWAKQLRESVYG